MAMQIYNFSLTILLLLALPFTTIDVSAATCPGGKDLIFNNGRILTMDSAETVAGALRIRGDRVTAIDQVGDVDDPCVSVIDLDGRTVIPGLIDSHTHFVRTAQQPGHFIEGLEAATSIAELQAALRAAAVGVPAGELIFEVGGFSSVQFREQRLPTLQELDAALPNHPLYLQQSYFGPAVTNTAGKRFFEGHHVSVDKNGGFLNRKAALSMLLRDADAGQIERRFLAYMAYANSLGLTMVVDQGCCPWLGTNVGEDELPGFRYAVQYWRDGRLPLRLRIQYDHRTILDQNRSDSVTARINNVIRGIGDGMLKVVGVGEHTVSGHESPATPQQIFEVYKYIAEQGWPLSQHAMREEEIELYLRVMEEVAAVVPLGPLRWTIEHVFEITEAQIQRLLAIDVSVRVQNQDYLNVGDAWRTGAPPFRTLLQSGIRMGAGTDSGVVAPLNPWLSIYYMVTGKDASGKVINPGQQISRMDALRLYTAANAWFTFEEDRLGTLEPGKYADLVVLDRPYPDVKEEDIKKIRSLLTLVNGTVVHARGPFAGMK